MKRKTCFIPILTAATILFFCFSCAQTAEEPEKPVKIENTLKSVSLFQDSIMIEPTELFTSLESINKAIDSIGYPDAGYKLWLVKSDSVLDFRFMVEGYWPSQAIYDTIHNHELYKNATGAEEEIWSSLKSTWYSRFTKVNQ